MAIHDCGADEDTDLEVTGSHGRNGVTNFVLGRVSGNAADMLTARPRSRVARTTVDRLGFPALVALRHVSDAGLAKRVWWAAMITQASRVPIGLLLPLREQEPPQ